MELSLEEREALREKLRQLIEVYSILDILDALVRASIPDMPGSSMDQKMWSTEILQTIEEEIKEKRRMDYELEEKSK